MLESECMEVGCSDWTLGSDLVGKIASKSSSELVASSQPSRYGRVDQIWSDRIFGSDLKRPDLVGSDFRIGSEMTRSGRIGFRI